VVSVGSDVRGFWNSGTGGQKSVRRAFAGACFLFTLLPAGLLADVELTNDPIRPSVLTFVAQAAKCTRDGIDRYVELRTSGRKQAPCEVLYQKPNEGRTSKTLWRAQQNYRFCATKFSGFVTKLAIEHDWKCALTGGNSAAVKFASNTQNERVASESAALNAASTQPVPTAVAELEITPVSAPKVSSETIAQVIPEQELLEKSVSMEDEKAPETTQATGLATTSTSTPLPTSNSSAKAATAEQKLIPVQTAVQALPRPRSVSSSDDPAQQTLASVSEPVYEVASIDSAALELALPALDSEEQQSRIDDYQNGAAVSMDTVRTRIPSGPYQAIFSVGADASACPPGGSFFWNTRDPDMPVLEMGLTVDFRFSTAHGRIGSGFALQAEPQVFSEESSSQEFVVSQLTVSDSGRLQASVSSSAKQDELTAPVTETICEYQVGGG